MAIITNEDVLNAIRGRYQSNPNNVSDDAAQAELVQIKTLLSGIESKIHTIQNGTQPAAVELKGSIPRKVTIETLASAQSVAASGNLDLPYTTQGESEVWVLVNIDKQPWSLRSRLLWASTYGVNNFYPPRNNVSTAYNTVSSPAGSLLLATRALGGGLPEITTMEDAKQYAGAYSTTFRIENGSAETATVTLKVIRIWR